MSSLKLETMSRRRGRPTCVWWLPAVLTACASTAVGADGASLDAREAGETADVALEAMLPEVPVVDLPQPDPSAPRLLSPLSATYVTNSRPTLRWALPPGATGARVELCRDRDCTRVVETLDVDGSQARPRTNLAPGVHFWRVAAREGSNVRSARSFTWMFSAPIRGTDADYATGVLHDLNADGFADLRVVGSRLNLLYPGGPEGPDEARVIEHPADEGSGGVLLGDVNGDGYPDLLGFSRSMADASHVEALATIHYGGPDLAALPQGGLRFPGRRGYVAVHRLGDVDYDGYSDISVEFIYVGHRDDPQLRDALTVVLLGSSLGLRIDRNLPLPSRPAEAILGTTYVYWIPREIGDLDGDQRNDFLCLPFIATQFALYRGVEPPQFPFAREPARVFRAFSPPPRQFLREEFRQVDRTLCDVNGDGRYDLIEFYSQQALGQLELRVYQRHWDGVPTAIPRGHLAEQGSVEPYIPCADVNNDGFSDIVLGQSSRAYIIPGRMDGSMVANRATRFDAYRHISVGGDLNGDGMHDIVIVDSLQAVRIFLGRRGEEPRELGVLEGARRAGAADNSLALGF